MDAPLVIAGDRRNRGFMDRYFSLPHDDRERNELSAHKLRVKSLRRTARILQLDHTGFWTSILSWAVCSILVVVIPVLRLCFVKATSEDTTHELVFQTLVVVVGTALSVVSFIFLSQAVRMHGFHGFLFLDAAMELQDEYDIIVEQSTLSFARLFIPSLVSYVAFKSWFFAVVDLEPLPFETKTTALSLSIIIIFTAASWTFQTTTYLYVCILFSTVCSLQEVKMRNFKELLASGYDIDFYYHKYIRIIKGLQATSHRFRGFLALIFAISILGFLASMYKIVAAERSGIDVLMAGEIVVLNVVSLSGTGFCLNSSSKLAHLHRKIVRDAASMHVKLTYESSELADSSLTKEKDIDIIIEKLKISHKIQHAYSKRAAFVSFLSHNTVGISVYGFVLDRFFIHTSVGALLTTTWFILGRSLG